MTLTIVGLNYPKIVPNLFLKADFAGVPSDTEVSNLGVTPVDGQHCQNVVDGKLYVRSGGSWGLVSGVLGTASIGAGSGVYTIQQSGGSYIATPGAAYGTLTPITNNTPDIAALILACWNAMTPLSIYGRINILPAANPYLWASSIGPITGMGLRGSSIAAWVSGSGPPATVIKLGNGLNAYALQYTTGTDNLNHLASGDGHSFVQHFDMQDLTWEGNSSNQASGGIWNVYSRNCSFENIEVENTKSDSFNFNGLSNFFGYFNVARRVSISNNPVGAGGFITNNCDENEWDHCLFNFVPTYCIKEQSGNSRIVACQFVSSGGNSIGSQTYTVVLSSLGTIITGCNWDTCKSGIHLAGSGQYSGKNIVYGNNIDMSLISTSVTAIYIGAQASTHDGDLIIANKIRGANQVNTAGAAGAAIILDGANNMFISNNSIVDFTGEGYTPRMTYGIAEINGADNNTIVNNQILNALTNNVLVIGASTVQQDNWS